MQMTGFPFGITDWSQVEPTAHKGETGVAYWRTQQFGGIRVRMVEYTPGYRADHWCVSGTACLGNGVWHDERVGTRLSGHGVL